MRPTDETGGGALASRGYYCSWRRLWSQSFGLRFESYADECQYVQSTLSSRIKCGSVLCIFFFLKQLLLLQHLTESGVMAGCRSQETHAISGWVFFGAMYLTSVNAIARRCYLSPALLDGLSISGMIMVQLISGTDIQRRRPRVASPLNDTFLVPTEDQLMWTSETCSHVDLLAIEFARVVFISLVVGCGFARARFSWVLALAWTSISVGSFVELVSSVGWDILTDLLLLPGVAWLLAAGSENARRELWQRQRIVQAQIEELERVSTAREEEQRRNERLRELKCEQDRFLAAMSHELKTPLSGMIGMLHVAKLEHLACRDAQHVDRCVGKALTCGKLLSFLVDDLLDCTRLATGNFHAVPSRVALLDLVRSVLDLASHLNKHQLDVRLHAEDSLEILPRWVMLDGNRAFQVLLNVVTNALKFTPRGGSVTVRAGARQQGPTWVVTLAVEDTGIGIPANKISHCFEPFAKLELARNVSTSATPDGTSGDGGGGGENYHGADSAGSSTGSVGLGLHLCKQMVGKMGGSMRIESQVGAGTTVFIEMPTRAAPLLSPLQGGTPEHAMLREVTASQEKTTRARPLRCLVAEDNAFCREVALTLLDAIGHEAVVEQVEDGAAAVAAVESAQQRHAPFDLILMDVMMPELDGLEASRRIRLIEEAASLARDDGGGGGAPHAAKIVAVTTNTSASSKAQCFDAGMDAFLSKPLSLEALVRLEVVRNVLDNLANELANEQRRAVPTTADLPPPTAAQWLQRTRISTSTSAQAELVRPSAVAPASPSDSIPSAVHPPGYAGARGLSREATYRVGARDARAEPEAYPVAEGGPPCLHFGSCDTSKPRDVSRATRAVAGFTNDNGRKGAELRLSGTRTAPALEMPAESYDEPIGVCESERLRERPAAAPPSLGAGNGAPTAIAPNRTGDHAPRCLVVDDNSFNREVARAFLEVLGCVVVAEAAGGVEAVAAYHRAHEAGQPLDVILMDVCMPGMDGPAVSMRLRELEKANAGDGGATRRVIIVAATGYAAADERQRCMDHGMDEYVTKPMSTESLRAVLLQAGVDV